MSGARDWRLVVGSGAAACGAPEAADGATNMAIDQALLDAVADGAPPVVRLYRWSPATLSFGRNQPTRGLYDEAAAAGRGIAFVRRPTGGQAVLHDRELTYAVVAPVAVIGKPRAAYRRINEALVAGLGRLGLEAAVAGGFGQSVPPGAMPGARPGSAPSWMEACFRRPERGEVVVGGKKLVGSAQRTESRTILQHGSILMGGSQSPVEELLRTPAVVAEPAGTAPGGDLREGRGQGGGGEQGWTTLARELGRRPGLAALWKAVVAGFEEVLGTGLAPSLLRPPESGAARELRSRFGSDAWTWRR
ncbi:MAG: lipoate--protein ligase family protein [Gemmatimonadota bacterium]